MRWLLASLVAGVVLAASPAVVAGAAPATSQAVEHGLAVAPVAGTVQREFDPPASRYGPGHRGVDLAATPGEPVVAAIGGVVSFSGAVANIGWVTVDHGGGLSTTYGPLEPRAVTRGERISRGALLGFVADGAAHLDWGARLEGEYVDPLALLDQWEAYLTHADAPPEPALVAAARDLARSGPFAGPGSRSLAGSGELGMPAAGPLTSSFGPRRHPVTGEHRHHAGVDIGAPYGAPVVAARAGVVTFAGDASGYGRTVILDHGNSLTTLYAHQSVLNVRAGDAVSAGEQIGQIGSSGLSTGPHLHFEVRRGGIAEDPGKWL